jgi:hypothetical protein
MVSHTSTKAAQRPGEDQQQPLAAATAATGKPSLSERTSPSQQLQDAAVSRGVSPAGDCMGCRLTGLALGVGGGGYVASRLVEPPYPKGAHRVALISVSVGLFALGIGRALGY